jgi:hypothetical protein
MSLVIIGKLVGIAHFGSIKDLSLISLGRHGRPHCAEAHSSRGSDRTPLGQARLLDDTTLNQLNVLMSPRWSSATTWFSTKPYLSRRLPAKNTKPRETRDRTKRCRSLAKPTVWSVQVLRLFWGISFVSFSVFRGQLNGYGLGYNLLEAGVGARFSRGYAMQAKERGRPRPRVGAAALKQRDNAAFGTTFSLRSSAATLGPANAVPIKTGTASFFSSRHLRGCAGRNVGLSCSPYSYV